MKTFKSIGAVVAGFLVVVILSTGTDLILESSGLFPKGGMLSTGYLGLALFYRTVYTVLGGYVTAKLAPQNPSKHVLVLAVIGTLAGVGGIVAGWDLSAHWYPIALAALAFPSVWLGGKLETK